MVPPGAAGFAVADHPADGRPRPGMALLNKIALGLALQVALPGVAVINRARFATSGPSRGDGSAARRWNVRRSLWRHIERLTETSTAGCRFGKTAHE
jgi:hypothetical protein